MSESSYNSGYAPGMKQCEVCKVLRYEKDLEKKADGRTACKDTDWCVKAAVGLTNKLQTK